MKTNFNVNAKHGGGTALLLMSRGFDTQKGVASDDSEVQLIRCGFDGNHLEGTSLALTSEHTIYHYHELHTDDTGHLCPAALFGNGHCCVVSNIASMGNCSCAVIFEAPATDSEESTTKISLGDTYGSSGSCFLILCSVAGDKETGNAYMVHQGRQLIVKILSPDKPDLWKFECSDSDAKEIFVTGPSGSYFAVLHNFNEEFLGPRKDKPMGKAYHTQAFDGSTSTTLLPGCSKYIGHSLLLLCSSSSGR